MKRHGFFELTGATIVGLTVAYVLWKQNPSISWLSFVGLVVIFLDRFPAMFAFAKDLVRGTHFVRDHKNIYDYKCNLLRKAKDRDEILFYSPIMCYGIYRLGLNAFLALQEEIESAVRRGVHVKIICDPYDLKTLKSLLSMLRSGADIRIINQNDPFRYFLVNSSTRKGIRPVTQDVQVINGLGQFRPMSGRAQILVKEDARNSATMFQHDWDERAKPLTKDMLEALIPEVLDDEAKLLRIPDSLD